MTAELVLQAAPEASELEIVWKLAQRLSDTEFVPQSLQGRPTAVLAAILTGREIGIGPMQSLQSINVIQGKPTLAPELMRAVVFRAGHRIDVLVHSDAECTLKGTRSDSGAEATVTWTMEDARQAKLAGKGAWLTYPRAMLLARATSELCRLLFADVIAGVSYIPEEIGGYAEPAIDLPPAEPMVSERDRVLLNACVDELEPEQRTEFLQWKQDRGFHWPWTVAMYEAMETRLTEIVTAGAVEAATSEASGEPHPATVLPAPAVTSDRSGSGEPGSPGIDATALPSTASPDPEPSVGDGLSSEPVGADDDPRVATPVPDTPYTDEQMDVF